MRVEGRGGGGALPSQYGLQCISQMNTLREHGAALQTDRHSGLGIRNYHNKNKNKIKNITHHLYHKTAEKNETANIPTVTGTNTKTPFALVMTGDVRVK